MGVLVLRSSVVAEEEVAQLTGLEFPSNGSGTVRFGWASPPNIVPLTLLWKVNPTQQTGYYTTFFWAEEGGGTPTSWAYFGCHPYPVAIGGQGANGTVHNWEISIDGIDYIVDDNANDTTVTKDQWYSQAAVASDSGNNEALVSFYWDLATSSNRVISYDTEDVDYLTNLPSNPGLFFGDAPWNFTQELLSGILRGIQIYDGVLTITQVQALRELETDAAVLAYCTAESITSLWYLNMNPTPDDITDKSSNDNDPAWVGDNRPTLYES